MDKYCTHFRDWAYSVNHLLDSTDSLFPCIRSVNRLRSFVGATENNQSLLSRRQLSQLTPPLTCHMTSRNLLHAQIQNRKTLHHLQHAFFLLTQINQILFIN